MGSTGQIGLSGFPHQTTNQYHIMATTAKSQVVAFVGLGNMVLTLFP
jgi:hypothetical protein